MLPVNQVINSERLLSTGCYQIKNSKSIEDVWLMKYLRDKGFSEDEIYETWKRIYLTKYPFYNDWDLEDWIFPRLWKRSLRIYFQQFEKITIFQEEIDFINNAEVLMRFKEFVLVLLAYAKAMGYTKIMVSDGTKGYLSNLKRDITPYLKSGRRQQGSDEFIKCQEVGLLEFHKGGAFSNDEKSGFAYYSIPFMKTEGVVAYEFDTIADIQQAFASLKCEAVCPKCGKVFELHPRTQRKICLECWKAERNQKFYSYLHQKDK